MILLSTSNDGSSQSRITPYYCHRKDENGIRLFKGPTQSLREAAEEGSDHPLGTGHDRLLQVDVWSEWDSIPELDQPLFIGLRQSRSQALAYLDGLATQYKPA
jgi:hypothetical protein